MPRSIALVGLEASFEVGGSLHAAGGEVGFQLFSAALRAGLPVVSTRRFELIPTFGGGLGLLRTLPTGFASAQNDLHLTTYVGLGALVRARLTPSLFADALFEIERILLRDRLQIREGDNLDRIFQPSPFAGRLSIGIAYEFH
jgi:hypothetical protein